MLPEVSREPWFRAGRAPALLLVLVLAFPHALPAESFPNPADLAWTGGPGTLAPSPVATGSGRALRFTCLFDQVPGKRVTWNTDVHADLRSAAGISVRFRAQPDAAGGVLRLLLYFRSGNGWYGTVLAPEGNGAWEELPIWKSATFIEGSPAGWGVIDGIRIAVMPTGARPAGFELSGFAVLPADPRVAVLRDTSALSPTDSSLNRSIADFPERVCRALRRSNVHPIFLDDPDIADGFLESRHVRVLVLPYNGAMAPAVAQRISKYLAGGGRVLGFYVPHPDLARWLDLGPGPIISATQLADGFGSIAFRPGMLAGTPARVRQASWVIQELRPSSPRTRVIASWASPTGNDTGYPAVLSNARGLWMSHVYLDTDPDPGSRMLLAMLGNWLPDLWRDAARSVVHALSQLPGAEAGKAQVWRRQATGQLAAGEYVQAIESAAQCRQAVERAELAAQISVKDEFRGAWCQRGYGVPGWTWETSVRNLKACGFNALFANMAWAGSASYPSACLPPAAVVSQKGDQLKLCAEACRKYGVQLHVWLACFNLGEVPAPAWVSSLREQGRFQRSIHGDVNVRWLCPSNPVNRRLEADVAREIVRNYPVAGIHLDFVRYADKDHCFCAACRRGFEAAIGRRVPGWPAAVRQDPQLARQWLAFRCAQVTAVVQEIAAAVAQEKPGVVLSAAVYDNPASAREAVGQDWPTWCAKRYVRFVAPMNYTADETSFREMVSRQLRQVRDSGARVYPGIGVRAAHLTPMQTCRQISIARSLGSGGFVVFEYNRDEATGIFPDLALGITKP